MACEKNQNTCASSASISGGVPPQTNRVANFIGWVTGVNAAINKIREVKKRRAERKYEFEGALGRVYFDDLGNGSISIQSVRPELETVLQLRNGLGAFIH